MPSRYHVDFAVNGTSSIVIEADSAEAAELLAKERLRHRDFNHDFRVADLDYKVLPGSAAIIRPYLHFAPDREAHKRVTDAIIQALRQVLEVTAPDEIVTTMECMTCREDDGSPHPDKRCWVGVYRKVPGLLPVLPRCPDCGSACSELIEGTMLRLERGKPLYDRIIP